MGVPQIILTVWYSLALGISLAEHGKVETWKENFFIRFACVVVVFVLLWWGGFYS